MFPKNQQIQKAITTLYQNIKDSEYDTRFSWSQLKKLCGIDNCNQNLMYYITNRACLLLMQYDQKYLISESGFGKRIINPEEHSVVAKKTVKRSVKIYKKAGAVLASTNMEGLTQEQQKEVIESANKYNTLQMFATEMLKKKKIGTTQPEDIKTAGLFLDAIKMFASKK